MYEADSFVPTAKLTGRNSYSIVNDYIGRPVSVFDEKGERVWETDYDIYGNLENLKGERKFLPFRQLGQYEDVEIELYYNRFRYYDSSLGNYISQDPIGLAGGNPTLYGYVKDVNRFVDVFGLARGPKTGAYKDLPHIANHTKHHIIPDALRDHPLLRDLNYDINQISNIVYLPHTPEIDSARTIHPKHGGHLASHYDDALAELDRINAMDASPEIKRMHVDAYTADMRNKYLNNDPNVKLTNKYN